MGDGNDVATWDIKAAGGRRLHGLDAATVSQGLRGGWLASSDEARIPGGEDGQHEWEPLATLAPAAFPVHVLLNAPAAHARRLGRILALCAGILNAVVGFLAATSEYLDVGIGRAALLLPVVTIGFLLMTKAPNIIVVGLTFTAVAVVLRAISGGDLAFGSALGIVVGGMVGLVLAGGLGAGVGYAIGYLGGFVWGRARRSRYQLPDARQEIPDDILDAHSS